jgi:cellobiose epimerase
MKMRQNELKTCKAIFEKELHENILGFWLKYAPDTGGDGFHGAVDLKGNPVQDAPRSCILNARILWTFSEAAIQFNKPEYGWMADRAFHVLQNYFLDKKHGGYYMSVDRSGKPLDTIKHTYVQAFALYALSKYYEWKPSSGILQDIKDYFLFLEEKTKDPYQPGYAEAFLCDWQPCDINRMADNNEPRTMNTHLHILEAYTAYYKICREEFPGECLKNLIFLFMDKIIRPSGHLGIFFTEDFTETAASEPICSFGHDIEASWLLWEAVHILGDKAVMEKMRPLSIRMLDAADQEGVDKDGGLFLESTRYGSHVRTNKHWWLQAETLAAFMNGLELTSDIKYWEKLKLSWSFIDRHVIDHVHGEWFTKVNRLGVPFLVEPADDPSPYYRNDWKIDPWKCPYHNGRAMMILISGIEKLMKQEAVR